MKFRFWGGDEFAGLQIQRGRARAFRWIADPARHSKRSTAERITFLQNSFGLLAGQQLSVHRILREGLIHQSDWLLYW
jgi:hypothetical protein